MKCLKGVVCSGAVLLALGAMGCSSTSDQKPEESMGELALPLTTFGPSGTQYRLRDATFEIAPYYWDYYGYAGSGAGGSPGAPEPIVVSSEDDPDATSIVVDLEEGYYTLRLQPDWRLEKVDDSGAETVEATLLSSEQQWVWISRRSTSWAEYEFGLGERSIWMNGKLNVDIQVYETPDDLDIGYGGYGGTGGGYSGSAGSADEGVGGSY